MNSQTATESNKTADALMRIDELSEDALTSSEYFGRLFEILAQAVSATSGHVWQVADDELVPMLRLAEAEGEHPQWLDTERQLAVEAFTSSSAQFHFTDQFASPGTHQRCCLLVPLLDHSTSFGMVSLITYVSDPLEPERQLELLIAATQRVRKNFLFQYFAQSANQVIILRKAQQVTEGIGKYIEIKPLAFEVVSRLCEYFECDRVSLAFKVGKRCQLKGISNQPVFDKRSNVVRRQEWLAARVAETEQPLWFPNDGNMTAPSLRNKFDKYFEASNAMSIGLLPLFAEPKRRDDPQDIAATIRSDEERRECIGVLVLEGLQAPLDRETIERRWSRVQSPVSNSIANARKLDRLFLMPLWRLLGVLADFYRGHTRRKALLVTGLVAAIMASLIIIPADFKLRGEGNIRSREQQHVYAETEGTIARLLFKDGDVVGRGDLLISLKNPQLATRIAELEGKLREAEKAVETITLLRVTRSFTTEQEERELVRSAASEEVRVAGLREQLDVLKRTEAQLNVVSPMAGEVITWDTQRRLSSRPVKRGDRLLTVAQPSSGWDIELRIPDKRAGYLLRQLQQGKTRQVPIPVSFVLASDPATVHRGSVSEVAPKSNIDDKENENVIRVRVQLTEGELASMGRFKPGTTVIGHVHCGRASIAYCKLYEFFDWARRMWFRFVT